MLTFTSLLFVLAIILFFAAAFINGYKTRKVDVQSLAEAVLTLAVGLALGVF